MPGCVCKIYVKATFVYCTVFFFVLYQIVLDCVEVDWCVCLTKQLNDDETVIQISQACVSCVFQELSRFFFHWHAAGWDKSWTIFFFTPKSGTCVCHCAFASMLAYMPYARPFPLPSCFSSPVSWHGAHWHGNVEIPVSTMSSSVPWRGARTPLSIFVFVTIIVNLLFTATQSVFQSCFKSNKYAVFNRNVSMRCSKTAYPSLSAHFLKEREARVFICVINSLADNLLH